MTCWAAQKRWVLFVICGALALSTSATKVRGQQFVLKNGDTVVFYGDSITAQRLYTKDVEEFVLTRYPKMYVRFVNAGVPGDTTNGGYAGTMPERVQRDVAPFKPTTITVMLGMNDGGWGYAPPNVDDVFEKGYRAVLDALHHAAPDATLTLISPTPYDEITHGTEFPGYSSVINRFADDVRQIGAQLNSSEDKCVLIADFNQPLNDALARARTQFPELAPLIIPDRIHPSETGHWIMAAALMSAWHVDPIVSDLNLNATSAKVIKTNRTTVTKLVGSTSGLKWTQLDDALPLPLDFNNAMTPMLLKISDIAKLDQMILRIESLDPGQYELSIDGKAVASFSRDELQQGVNLALFKTPMLDQARGIDGAEDRRNTLDLARFILDIEIKQTPISSVTKDQLKRAQDELAAAIRKDLDPKPHEFELRHK